jgi:hypothetical protein
MRCRPGTVPVCGGPGSAVHRSALLRAAPHPGHTMASDCSRHALAGPIPVFSCFSPDSDSSIPSLTISSTHTFSFPRRIFAPGFCIVASLTPNRGVGGAPRNVWVLSGTPVRRIMTRYARRLRGALRPMTRDARLSALHRGGFGLPGPRFRLLRRPPSYNGGQVPCGSVQRAPRTQVVVPGGRGPCLPRRTVTSHPPQDATPRSAFRIVSGDAPQ